MLNAIVRFSIRFRGIVIALAALCAGYGIYAGFQSKVDVFPEFAPALVVANAEAPGFSAGQVESLVTQPIESALGGLVGLDTMRSRSLAGLSVVTLTFRPGTDVRAARQLVAERLQALGSLPQGVHAPTLLPLTSSTATVMILGLTSRERSPIDLRTVADWVVKPRLLAVPGVADTVVFGGDVARYAVQASPDALLRHGLGLQDVIRAAGNATGVRGLGFVDSANQRIPVGADVQPRSADDIANTIVAFRNGAGIRLRDVAEVRVSAATRVGDASIMGEPGVMMLVDTQYGADPTEVTRGLERVLDELAPALKAEQVVVHPGIFRAAGFIGAALSHLRTALVVGSVLVVVVLALFLAQARTALISVIAIPLSLLTAVILLHGFGVALNTMTLGGLAIALGEVVDDAIVDVENIHRRLRLNAALEYPEPAARVVLRASLEVRSAVVFATLIVVLAFLPVVTLPGVSGALFAPLGWAYVAAVIASLGVALTVTPALCFLLLARRPLRNTEPTFVRRLKDAYARLLRGTGSRPGLALAILGAAGLAAIALVPFLSPTFIPDLKEGHYILHATAIPGTSLEEMMRVGARLTETVRKIPGVRIVAQRAGRAADLVDPAGPEVSEIEIDLDKASGAGQARTLDAIRKAVATFPGLDTSINTFLKERLDETISGSTAPLTISVFGNDLDVIDEKAREVVEVVGRLAGAAGVARQAPAGGPQLTVRLHR
ncbi:MAG TPA: efflux RND transporter permease subunit, partial [Usitatibacter sp.]|nr:efflux RND transporter permease subunit [Usitatibacter sp.]